MADLTKAQRNTLAAVEAGGVSYTNTGYGSWRIFGATPGVVGKLERAGLLEKLRVDDRNYRFSLTPAGRAVLDAGRETQREVKS